jgi:hypothetical protein
MKGSLSPQIVINTRFVQRLCKFPSKARANSLVILWINSQQSGAHIKSAIRTDTIMRIVTVAQ